MSFKSFVLLLSLVASASALTTPHVARNHHHRALAHRAASVDIPSLTIRKRADGKRCKARPTSSSAPIAHAAPSPTKEAAPIKEVAPTKEAAPTQEAAPTKEAEHTTKAQPTTTKEQPQEPATTPKPPKASPTPPPPPPEPKPTTEKPPVTTKAPSSGGGGGGSGPSFMVGTQTGQGTFYATGLGACGIVNKDTDYIAAVSHLLFDIFPGYNGVNPNNNPICGRKVRATYGGKSVTVAITDRCEGCAITDLDFSPSAFGSIAAFAEGRISGMTWVWA